MTDKAVAIACIFFSGLWAGVELTTALRPHRVEYLLVKDAPKPAPLPSWYESNCTERFRLCKARQRMDGVRKL